MVVAYLQKDVRYFTDLVPVSKICETEKKKKSIAKNQSKAKTKQNQRKKHVIQSSTR